MKRLDPKNVSFRCYGGIVVEPEPTDELLEMRLRKSIEEAAGRAAKRQGCLCLGIVGRVHSIRDCALSRVLSGDR